MVAIFTGLGAGFVRGSANTLGGAGQLGNASQGRGGEAVSINAATGNLLITQQDEFLIGRGLDIGVSRTYNSLIDAGDGDNGDQWQQSSYRRIFDLVGTANTSGSSVRRQDADGSVVSYGWSVARGLYVSTDGDGAYDTLSYNGSAWTWVDGASKVSEVYSAYGANNWRITQALDRVNNGTNSVTYSYIDDKLDKIRSADGSWLQYVWSGNNITEVRASYSGTGVINQTRTRYTYDGLNRLTQVTVDLSPTDNSIADGKTYVTSYTYHGNSKLIATISQTDGSLLSMSYDVAGRVTSYTQTVAAGDVRTTSLTYGLNFTSVTGPDGQTTRLDYAGDNLVDGSMWNWYLIGTDKEVAGSLGGETAVKFTSPVGANFSTVFNSLSATAGDTFKFELSLQAVPGSSADQAFALHGNSSGFGTEYASARIVSGPGQVEQITGGLWRVIGLSTTQATRIELIRTFSQTEGGGMYIYVDQPNNYRDGQQLLVAGPHLSKVTSNLSTRKQLTKITAPPAIAGGAAQTINYAYDSSGNLASVTDALGKVTSFTYDANGNQLTATDPNGNVVTRTYDAQNNKLTETTTGSSASGAAVALTTRYAYDGDNQLRFVVTPEGRVTEYYYNPYGQMYFSAEYPQASYNISTLAPNQSISQGALDTWKQSFDNTYSQMTESWFDARGNIVRSFAYGRSGYSWAVRDTSDGYTDSYFTYDHAGRLLSRNNVNEVAETFVYDGLNRLIGSTDLAGGTTNIVFNDAATQTVVTLGNGQVTTSTYNKAGDLVAVTAASDTSPTANSTFKYDKNGRLRVATDGLGYNSYYVYDKAGRKTADVSHNGELVEYRYDAADRVVATIRYHYLPASGQLATLANPDNSLTIDNLRTSADTGIWLWNVYDSAGRLAEEITGDGRVTTFAYDQSNRLIETRKYVNVVSVSGFYAATPTSVVLPPAHAGDAVSRIFYDRDGRTIGALDAEGYLSENVYDKAGQLVEEIRYAQKTNSGYWASGTFDDLRSTANPGVAANRSTRHVYDGRGLKRYTINAQGVATRFDYNAAGRLTQTTSFAAAISTSNFGYDNVKALVNAVANSANDRTNIITYNARGQVASSTDAGGLTTNFTYDVVGNVIKTVAGDRVTRNWYTQKGELRFSVDAEGFVTENVYDALGQRLSSIRYESATSFGDGTSIGTVSATVVADFAAGRYQKTAFSYGARGELTSSYDAYDVRTNIAYFGTGQAGYTWLAFGTADQSDALINYFNSSGQEILKLEASGETGVRGDEQRATYYYYDGLGNLTSVVDPRGITTSYTYDKLGRVTSATDGQGGQTLYQYDAFGNQTAERDARGFWTYNYYDNLGRLIQTTDAANVATLSYYNGFGELTSVNRYGAVTSFQYDKMGHLTRSTDARGFFETFSYDVYGNRISTIAKTSSDVITAGGTTTYTYDRRGLLLTETLPQASYDNAGNVVASTVTNKYEYDAFGNRRKLIEAFGLPEARTTEYIYDKNNRLIQTIGQTFLGLTPNEYITYDARGNVTSTTNAADGRSVYYYDDLNRKTVEINPVGTYTKYTYDKNGNVTEIRIYETAVGVPADGGSEEEAPGAPVGNYRQTTFTYDNLNRMVTSSVHGAPSGRANSDSWDPETGPITTSYEYDANGNVVKQTDSYGNATYSYYDAMDRKTAQVDQENYLTVWNYDYNGNVSDETLYVNKIGSASALTISTGLTATQLKNSVAASTNDRKTVYGYDLVGNRVSETRYGVLIHNGTGGTTTTNVTVSYAYNGLRQLVLKTEATGDFTYYGYDAAGRLTVEFRSAFVDHTGGWVTPTVDYFYNGVNNLSRTVQRGSAANAQRVTTYGYDGGKLRWVTDAEGYTRNYSYDRGGRQTQEYYTRNKSNGLAQTNESGNAIIYDGNMTSYDVMGRVVSKWQAVYSGGIWTTKGPVTELSYNAFGDVVSTKVGGITQQQNQYDLAGRLTGTTSGDGIWKYFGYDKNGNQTAAISSAGGDLGGSFAAALMAIGAENVNGTFTAYDKRNMATSVVEEGRRFSASGALQKVTTGRTYTAFGEVASETNALNATVNYTYNTIGKMIRSESPAVAIVGENGIAVTVRPAEDFYYDASGRLVATRDANGAYTGEIKQANTGNLTILTLLTGTGYNGAEAQVVSERHADGGIKQTRYDIHGDARILIDEVGRQTTRSYDLLGRMISSTNAAGRVDKYRYDILGQQVKHWYEYTDQNSQFVQSDDELTDYDIQGRVISQRSFGGDVTTTSYSWEAVNTPGLGQIGGWLQRTDMANGLYSLERTDLFGRITWKRDLGGFTTDYSYDVAGRMVSSNLNGELVTNALISFSWFNSGGQASVTISGGVTATYGYDLVGNRTSEYATVSGAVIKNQTVTYDALRRITNWTEIGNATAPYSNVATSYDASGNVRRTFANYYSLDPYGTPTTETARDYWYRYDSMNRLVTDRGILSGGAIIRGSEGKDISYNAAGDRTSVTRTATLSQVVHKYRPYSYAPTYYYAEREDFYGGTWTSSIVQFTGNIHESYGYDAAGRLASVYVAQTSLSFSEDHTSYSAGYLGDSVLRSLLAYDPLGRMTSQSDYDIYGVSAVFSRTSTYNSKGQLTSDTSSTKKTDGKTYTSTNYYYYVGHTTSSNANQYLLGSVAWTESTSSVDNANFITSRTVNSYKWRDGAVQSAIKHTPNITQSTVFDTSFTLNSFGQLISASIADGKPRSVSFTLDELGQIIRRDESAPAGQTGSPHEVWYRFGGRQVGYTGNNGTADVSYDISIAERRNVAPTSPGTYRNGQTTGTSYADFAQSYDPINSYYQGAAGGSYRVEQGDTLASIAQSLYGDSSLWYKIGEANGLSAGATLVEGQSLVLPTGVVRSKYNTGTFQPYNQNEAIGDLSPTAAKPPKKPKCGVFGQILSTIVAVAASYFLGPVWGNLVSQGFNNVIGTQNGFSWKSLGLSVVAAGVTAGLDGAFSGVQSAFVRGALQGATASALTQGIGVATGLQDKFSWTGVAAAGVAGGLSAWASNKLGIGRSGEKWDNSTHRWVQSGEQSFSNSLVSNAAGAIADAATRSALSGSSFGRNLVQGLPNLIGTVAGRALARRIDGDGDGKWGKSKDDGTADSANASTDPQIQSPDEQAAANPAAQRKKPSVGDVLRNISNLPSALIGSAVRGTVTTGIRSIETNIRADNIINELGSGFDFKRYRDAAKQGIRMGFEFEEIKSGLRFQKIIDQSDTNNNRFEQNQVEPYDRNATYQTSITNNEFTYISSPISSVAGYRSRFNIDILQEDGYGGHTYEFHVGKSDDFMRRRLSTPYTRSGNATIYLTETSTFMSVNSANRLVNRALSLKANEVDAFLRGDAPSVFIKAYIGSPTGRTMYSTAPVVSRGGGPGPFRTETTYGVGVFLRRAPYLPNGFYVRTSYPISLSPINPMGQ